MVASAGGTPRELTPESANALTPSWSPDGEWLYFSSDRGGQMNLWKARFDNGRLGAAQQLTAGSTADLAAQAEPAGTRVAYGTLQNSLDIWEYELASGRLARVTAETSLEDTVRPSPDGKWLAFGSNRLAGNHVWLLNRKTASITQVTSMSNSTIQGYSHWSWDSKYLFYGSGDDIWRYEVSTGSSHKVVERVDGVFCLSADDRFLIFGAGPGRPSNELGRVELSTGKEEVVTRISRGDTSDPACSPDGRWIAFHVQEGNGRKVWLVPSSGGEARQLTFGESEDSHPAWSADSRLIYFIRNHQDIYVVPRDGGQPRPVTQFRSFSITLDYPVATGDGKKLLFTRIDKAGDIYLLETPTH